MMQKQDVIPDVDGREVPHTQVHLLLRRVFENLQDVLVSLLLALLLALSLQVLWRIAKETISGTASTSETLGEIIYVLILTELYRLLIFYLREHRISVALAVEVALVAMLREIMLLGLHDLDWTRLVALSLLLAVLGGLLAMERWLRLRHGAASEMRAH